MKNCLNATAAKVLSLLNRNRERFSSGQEIANTLNVSRTAVWKAIENLRREGYEIKAETNKGYKLSEEAEALGQDAIVEELTPEARAFYNRIACFNTIDSTNAYISGEQADSPEGLVVAAKTQTSGKGRFNRVFYCRKDAGVYFSVLLRPFCSVNESSKITAAAAVAAAKACENVAEALQPGDVKIKWVNDLYLNDKKICGILTEGRSSLETGKLGFAVLGVGINLFFTQEDRDNGLVDVAGSLFQERPPIGVQARTIAAFLNEFYVYYCGAISSKSGENAELKRETDRRLAEEYCRRQLLLDQKIEVQENLFDDQAFRPATAVGIDERFRLLVRYDDAPNRIVPLNGGDVRTRRAKN